MTQNIEKYRPHYFWKPDPDSHQNVKPEPDLHQSAKPGASEAHVGAVKAHMGAKGSL
jgi:hypothetical protein